MTHVDEHTNLRKPAAASPRRSPVRASRGGEPDASSASTLSRLDGWAWRSDRADEGPPDPTPPRERWTSGLYSLARCWAWARILGG
jgi:hypothetical protein